MGKPQEAIQKELAEGWRDFISNLEKALDSLEKEIDFTGKMADACTAEWCQATSTQKKSA